MKNLKKVLSVMMTISLVLAMTTNVYALGGFIGNVTPGLPSDDGGMGTMINKVLGLVQTACIFVSFGMLIYLGIKYVTCAANEKADVKSGTIKFLIGAIVVLSGTSLFRLIVQMAEEVKPN